jgi:D-amino-acid dehydrogenase
MADKADVIVLGGGMVGVSVALHLQKLGRRTILIERTELGLGASFGNAGLIQSEAIMPHPFPRRLGEILHYALNRSSESYYHLSALPGLAKPFLRYWRDSHPDRIKEIAQARRPLINRSIADHLEMAAEANALDLFRHNGWTQVYTRQDRFDPALEEITQIAREFEIPFVPLSAQELATHEPHLRLGLVGGIHWPQPISVIDPHALTLAYAKLFIQLGGELHTGDVWGLEPTQGGWNVISSAGTLTGREVVIATGISAPQLTRQLGYRPPIFAKRGYHLHFGLSGNASLTRAILDAEAGYVLVPMRRGIRLTTGAEFARPNAAPTPVQLARTVPMAHALLPALGDPIDSQPWLGSRPCLPDMLPIIGRVPRHPGAWFAFGHAHQGLTLGPTTGRLLAQMMTGATPFTDPAPYRAERFQ